MESKIIRIRKGLNGFKYSACDNNGNFLGNFSKLSEIQQHWKLEIKRGQIVLVRELDQVPDVSTVEETQRIIKRILKSYCKK